MSVADGTAPCSKEKGSRARRFGLALALGLLAMMFFVLTANAYVAVKVDDSLVDFDQGSFVYTGLLDIPDKGIHSVQLLPVGLTGEWQTSPQHLPERLADMATAANGNALYVIGGTDPQNDPRTEVYSTIISDVWGTLVPWRTETALPEARTGPASAVDVRSGSTSILYVVGGLAAHQGQVVALVAPEEEAHRVGERGQSLPQAARQIKEQRQAGRVTLGMDGEGRHKIRVTAQEVDGVGDGAADREDATSPR